MSDTKYCIAWSVPDLSFEEHEALNARAEKIAKSCGAGFNAMRIPALNSTVYEFNGCSQEAWGEIRKNLLSFESEKGKTFFRPIKTWEEREAQGVLSAAEEDIVRRVEVVSAVAAPQHTLEM